jgi:hypothetical protein
MKSNGSCILWLIATLPSDLSAVSKGAASDESSIARAAGASVTASATCKPESRRNLKPTKPAIQMISDADRKRKILITQTHHDPHEMAGKRRVLPGLYRSVQPEVH